MNVSNNNNTTTADSNISTGMSMSDCCIKGTSTSNDDGVCVSESNVALSDAIGCLRLLNIKDMENKAAVENICANCGNEGDDVNNICNKCKQVKYCNAACKKKHRHKHKKDCEEHLKLEAEKRNEELRLANESHDKKLFKQPPPQFGDCPICFLRMPLLHTGWRYYTCCGKQICSGCVHAPLYDNQGNKAEQEKCPFCRAPHPTKGENTKRLNKRVESNDGHAMYNIGCDYRDGADGYPQDYSKALEVWHKAGELGDFESFLNIGYAYNNGEGVEVDMKKANHYYELAAMGGSAIARRNLGNEELQVYNNLDRAMKHYMIAVRSGCTLSLEQIKELYKDGHATKDDYTKALQSYQEYLSEIKSVQRDKAAAASEYYRYY